MKIKLFVASLVLIGFLSARADEPTGGVIKDIVFFHETINDSLRFHTWGCSGPTISTLANTGNASTRYVPGGPWAGVQIFWGGIPGTDWWGPDTSVFWAHSNSVFTMWVRSGTAGHTISIGAHGFSTFYGTVGTATIRAANVWQRLEFPMPATTLNLPLKGFEINFGLTSQPIYIDDFVVTNVRMYAGRGSAPILTMNHIAASQIGYAPNMKKQFTSPVPFDSFAVVRATDSVRVFNGGTFLRTISSFATGGAAAYIGDFSALTTPGRYKIVIEGLQSFPFNIDVTVFDEPTRAAQRFFYFQRAFTAVEMPYAEGPWVHPSDSAKAPPGVRKGWHDAGDLTIYMPSMAQAIWWMLETWMDFRPMSDDTNIPESGNGLPDLLDETRWGLEWVLSQQDPNGGFWGNSCANSGNFYPYGTTTPDNVSGYIRTIAPTVQNTAKSIAVLAYASKVYESVDSSFAAACLDAARAGWVWMIANPLAIDDRDIGHCGVYAQGSDPALLQSNRMWAAAAMLYATGELAYETAFQSNYLATDWISSYNKSEAYAAKMYLRCSTNASVARQNEIRSSFLSAAAGVRSDGNAHPFQWATHYYWGSLSNGAHRAGQFSWMAYKFDSTRAADRDQLLHNVHYMFGRNFLNISYMAGSGAWGATQWRLGGFHFWMKALNANPWHFPGAVAGGPNESPSGSDVSYPSNNQYGYQGDPRFPRDGRTPVDGRFTDNDSWSTNEIAVNWQGAILYMMHAAKSVAHDASIPLPTADTSKPVINGVGALDITSSRALIAWTTNEPASSMVEYGTTTGYGMVATSPGATFSHSVLLDTLLSDTMYHYRVRAVDTAGNVSYSPDHAFMTGIKRSFVPTDVTLMLGFPSAGTFKELNEKDKAYLVTKSTNGLQNIIDWFGSTTVDEPLASGQRLVVQYDGRYSSDATAQNLYLFDWTTTSWTQIDSQAIGTSDQSIERIISLPAAYISPAHEIRLRVRGSGVGARTCSADLVKFTLETLGTNLFRPGEHHAVVSNGSVPTDYNLYQNYPNPFNPTTTIRYDLPEARHVTLKLFDILGREVRTLVDELLPAGFHRVVLDASSLSSGTYFCRIVSGHFTSLKKMLVLK